LTWGFDFFGCWFLFYGLPSQTQGEMAEQGMAIMIRWRMPPDIWWGYASTLDPGSGIPTSESMWMASSRFAFSH